MPSHHFPSVFLSSCISRTVLGHGAWHHRSLRRLCRATAAPANKTSAIKHLIRLKWSSSREKDRQVRMDVTTLRNRGKR